MGMLKNQEFNDGVVNIFTVANNALPGDTPKKKLRVKHEGLRYEERTVGMGRFWTAAQNNVKIDIILRVPRMRDVCTQDIAIPSFDKQQYEIKQVQYPPDVQPPVMDLSLQRLGAVYELDG